MKYLSVDRFCELYKSCLSDVLLIHVPTNWYVTDGNVSLWRLHIFFPLHHILSVCSYSYLYQAVGMCIVTRNHYKNIVDTSFWYFICTIDTCDFDFIDTCTLKQTSSSAVYGSAWAACYCAYNLARFLSCAKLLLLQNKEILQYTACQGPRFVLTFWTSFWHVGRPALLYHC